MLGQEINVEYKLLEHINYSLLDSFTCGNDGIDEYVKHKSLSDYTTVTKMVINADNNDVICVYSLCCSSLTMTYNQMHYPYPAVEIKIFAMNKSYQDMRYSDDPEDGCLSNIILNTIIGEIWEFTDTICGANVIILYSTDDGYEFYKRNGFKDFVELAAVSSDRFVEGCHPMHMTMR